MLKNIKNITFENKNLTSLNELHQNNQHTNGTQKAKCKIIHGLKEEERISNNNSRKIKEKTEEVSKVIDRSPSFAVDSNTKIISEKHNYATHDQELENIEEIPSNDEMGNQGYIPRRSTRKGVFTKEELNIREDNLRGGSIQSRDVYRMQPESEGNRSYYKENSSYYINSPNQSYKNSHKQR